MAWGLRDWEVNVTVYTQMNDTAPDSVFTDWFTTHKLNPDHLVNDGK